MNFYVITPKTKMEHLEDTTRLLQEPSWAAKVDIKDAFWVSPDSSSVQKVLLLLGRRDHVDVQKDAFRLDHSSLGLHPANEGDKKVSKEARHPNKLIHRRFYPMGIHKVPSLVPSRVDKEGPRMVRVQVKPQEDLRVSSAV